jgi:hypothetical protein
MISTHYEKLASAISRYVEEAFSPPIPTYRGFVKITR